MNNREHAIEGLKKYITERGLEVRGIEPNDDGSVRLMTTTSNIRSINLKEFMEYSGYTEYRIGYDAVDFRPEEGDVYTFQYDILTEDPMLKVEEVKQGLLAEFEGVIQESEIEVEQKMEQVAEGTNSFTFTITTNNTAGQLAESMYLQKMIPATSMADHVKDMLSSNEKPFGADEVKAKLAEADSYQLRSMKDALLEAAEMSGKFGVVSHTKDIYARIAMIEEVLASRPVVEEYDEEDVDYDDDEYEEGEEDEDEFDAITNRVGVVFGSVALEREELASMDSHKLLNVKRHLEDARESAGCLPILRDSINACLAIIEDIERERK